MSEVLTQNELGEWEPAIPLPYYPHWRERLGHLLGFHIYYGWKKCLICGKPSREKGGK